MILEEANILECVYGLRERFEALRVASLDTHARLVEYPVHVVDVADANQLELVVLYIIIKRKESTQC